MCVCRRPKAIGMLTYVSGRCVQCVLKRMLWIVSRSSMIMPVNCYVWLRSISRRHFSCRASSRTLLMITWCLFLYSCPMSSVHSDASLTAVWLSAISRRYVHCNCVAVHATLTIMHASVTKTWNSISIYNKSTANETNRHVHSPQIGVLSKRLNGSSQLLALA